MILNPNHVFFWCVGISRTFCCWRIGFRCCHIALISVSNIPMFAFCYLAISGVSWSCCYWMLLDPPMSYFCTTAWLGFPWYRLWMCCPPLGCCWSPGVLCLSNVILGLSLCTWCCPSSLSRSQDGGDPFQMQITLQGKCHLTGLAHRQPSELPRPWAQAEAWRAVSQAMLDSGYLCVPGAACLVHPGAKMAETPSNV